MADVFVSYARTDRNAARAITETLEEHGWSTWWDPAIPLGGTFSAEIERQLDNARCVVVLWSAASVASEWVRTEAAEGLKRKILVPVSIDKAKLPLEFRNLQTADLSDWNLDRTDPHLEKVVQHIRKLLDDPSRSPVAKDSSVKPVADAVTPSASPAWTTGDPYCLVIASSFENSDQEFVRERAIHPAVRRYGFHPLAARRLSPRPSPLPNICARIADADFVVADLTGSRGDGYFYAGYAHAVGRPVILAVQASERLPFDVSSLPLVRYEDTNDFRTQLEQEIQNRILASEGRSRDPYDNRGKFGGSAFNDPYIVTGRVRHDPSVRTGELRFLIDLRVRSVEPSRPLSGRVTFCLHGEYEQPRQSMRVDDGEAIFTDISCYGPFTVGVILHESKKQLEIDLATLPGATAEFRSR